VNVTANGDESYAAGFFMDNYTTTGAAAAVATASADSDAAPASMAAMAADPLPMGGLLPEPATLGLLLLGLGGVVLRRRRR
jgi:hypothetical protein